MGCHGFFSKIFRKAIKTIKVVNHCDQTKRMGEAQTL